MQLGDKQPKGLGIWDYTIDRADTITISIFQWVPKSSGTSAKKGRTVARLRGTPEEFDALCAEAIDLCATLQNYCHGHVEPSVKVKIKGADVQITKSNDATFPTHQASLTRLTGRSSAKNYYNADQRSIAGIAKSLGVPVYRIKTWIKDHDLPCEVLTSCHKRINVADVIALAKSKPELFGGIDYKRLVAVLKDEALAEQCASLPNPPHGKWNKVRCIDTGEIYESTNEAAEAVDRDPEQIRAAIRGKRKSANMRWERVAC